MTDLFLIKKPVMTEKANALHEARKYTFLVRDDATKAEVKKLVKHLYRVDSERVNIVRRPGKPKRFRSTIEKRGAYKKAIVTLKEGQKIELGA